MMGPKSVNEGTYGSASSSSEGGKTAVSVCAGRGSGHVSALVTRFSELLLLSSSVDSGGDVGFVS